MECEEWEGVVMQAVTLVLGDPVAFRFQWPRSSELKINTMTYRVYSRQATSKVGNNLRDEPANLAQTVFPGRNRVRLKVHMDLAEGTATFAKLPCKLQMQGVSQAKRRGRLCY
jgi:hypothetical protein